MGDSCEDCALYAAHRLGGGICKLTRSSVPSLGRCDVWRSSNITKQETSGDAAKVTQ